MFIIKFHDYLIINIYYLDILILMYIIIIISKLNLDLYQQNHLKIIIYIFIFYLILFNKYHNISHVYHQKW